MADRVRTGYCWIRTIPSEPDNIRLNCLLGPSEPKVITGYGGWSTVDRPRRRQLTEWVGSEPLRIEMSLMINDFEDRDTVEPEIRALEKMAGLTKDGEEPPLLWWEANAPHDHREAPHLTWVIESITWGTALRNHRGTRTRQAVDTVTLLNYVPDEYLPFASRKPGGGEDSRGKKRGRGTRKGFYVVRRGDTLTEIAAKELGKASRWREIANLNKIRDPRNIKVGQRLKLPR